MRQLLVVATAAVVCACSGSSGRDGAPCTVDTSVSPPVLRCPDGTSTPIAGAPGTDGQDGQNGQDGQDGQDGQNGMSGADGSSCSATDNGDGTVTVTCTNGTSATIDTGVGLAPGTLVGIARYYGRNDGGGILVELVGSELSTVTEADGAWSLVDVPAGVYTLRFSAPGYADHVSESFAVLEGTFTMPPVVLTAGRRVFAAHSIFPHGDARGPYALYRTSTGLVAWDSQRDLVFAADGWTLGELDEASRTVTLAAGQTIAVLDLDDGSITPVGDEVTPKGKDASGLLFFRETSATLPIGEIVQWRTSTRQLEVRVSDVLHTVVVDGGFLYAWGLGGPPVTFTQVDLATGASHTTPLPRAPYDAKRMATGDVMIRDVDVYLWTPGAGDAVTLGRQGVAAPNGRSIAYLVDMPQPSTLRWLDLDTDTSRELDADVYSCVFSPDSTMIAGLSAFDGNFGSLTLYDGAPGGMHVAMSPAAYPEYEFLGGRYLRFVDDADATHLYEVGVGDHVLGSAWRFPGLGDFVYQIGSALRLFRLSDGTSTLLGQDVTNFFGFTEQHLAWTQTPAGGPVSIHAADLTATTITPLKLAELASGDVGQPAAASADKSMIAYLVSHTDATSSLYVYDVADDVSHPVEENGRPTLATFIGDTLVYLNAVVLDFDYYGPFMAWVGPNQAQVPLTTLSSMMSSAPAAGDLAAFGDIDGLEDGRVTVWDATNRRATKLSPGADVTYLMIDQARRSVVYARAPVGGYGPLELLDATSGDIVPLARSGRPLQVLPAGALYAMQSSHFPDLLDDGLYVIQSP